MRFLIPVVFLAAAAWFAVGSRAVVLPETARAVVPEGLLTDAPPRAAPERPTIAVIGGVEQKCSDCHAIFESAGETPAHLRQHEHIVLDHGVNAQCLNCHARTGRNDLELYGGARTPLKESAPLCGKCHGPTYRDWEAGIHGRVQGSWDPDDPTRRLLRCVECHDPHRPAFPPIAPLPGPAAWRAPAFDGGATGASLDGPLHRWRAEGEGTAPDREEDRR